MRVFTLVLLPLLFAGVPAPPAVASQSGNIELCNHFPVPMRFAVAWKARGVPYSKGWYTVGSDHCTRVAVAAAQIYWRAETNDYVEPDGRTVRTSWGAHGRGFCTSQKGFNFYNAQGPCGKNKIAGYLASFKRTDGSPLYQTVTIARNGTSSQSVSAGHYQELESP